MLGGEWGDAWLQGSRAYYAEALAQRDLSILLDCLMVDASLFGKQQALRWLMRHGLFVLLPSAFQELLRQLVRRMRGNGIRDTYWLSPEMRKQFGYVANGTMLGATSGYVSKANENSLNFSIRLLVVKSWKYSNDFAPLPESKCDIL